MFSRVIKSALPVSLTAIALFAGVAASAESVQTIQTLDRVDVYNKSKVLEMEFDDPGRTDEFAVLGIAPAAGSTGFSACQVTASQALYCIDGKDVVVWPKPAEATGSGTKLFSCADAALGFDGQPCTGLTVDDAGTIWVAGRKAAGAPAAAAYAITRVTPNSSGCAKPLPLPQPAGSVAPYCAIEYATGPRAFVGLSPIDGEVGAAFVPGVGKQTGPGVLGLEVTQDPTGGPGLSTAAIFFPRTPGMPISIGTGSSQWGLAAGEQLQSVTMLQLSFDRNSGGLVPRGTADAITKSFVLAATSRFGTPPPGRILAIDTQNPDLGDLTRTVAFEIFDIAAERETASTTFPLANCSSMPQQYGVRASSKSGRVYLTDRTFCQAAALESAAATGKPFALRNVQEEPGTDLTFSTTAAYPPDANTIAAGVVVNLSTCGTNCVLLSYKDGTSAASLSNVKLTGSKSGMTLFQVKDVPDCRWAPDLCAGKSNVVIDAAGNSMHLPPVGAVTPNGPLPNANSLFLNVTPLLPVEITALFDGSGTPPKVLPRMLISPQYRAQEKEGFLFEALFGITDDGVVFQGTFDLLFDVGKLVGNPADSFDCGYDYSEANKPNLDWDVITTVSERVITAGGPGLLTEAGNQNRYVDTLVNTGCINPTKGSGERWSMYAYNLEIAPDKDDVFAQLLLTLFDDLEETRAELACKKVDSSTTGAAAPLSTKACTSLRTAWSDAKNSLNRCYSASVQPKSSASKERCNTFLVKLRAYQTTLNGVSISGPDPANRLGELKARVNVLFHVYNDRFLPSIPANGFTLN